MKTIHPLELEAIIETSQPVEMVDIRAREDFAKVHIEGAHSLPSTEVTAETFLSARELLPIEPVYLVSGSGASAQAVGSELEREGMDNLVVVSGGMQAWQENGLPVVRHRTMADWIEERRERVGALGLLA